MTAARPRSTECGLAGPNRRRGAAPRRGRERVQAAGGDRAHLGEEMGLVA